MKINNNDNNSSNSRTLASPFFLTFSIIIIIIIIIMSEFVNGLSDAIRRRAGVESFQLLRKYLN